jgi:hypothetical protein
VTDTISETRTGDGWEGLLATLRQRYPGQRDSVLFCVHKLQQNPDLTLRDFRDEAALHGIPTAGRALHSARQLLGLVRNDPAAEAPSSPDAGTETRRQRRQTRRDHDGDDGSGGSIETKVVEAVRQIQSAGREHAERLRVAIRDAITLLQRALDD